MLGTSDVHDDLSKKVMGTNSRTECVGKENVTFLKPYHCQVRQRAIPLEANLLSSTLPQAGRVNEKFNYSITFIIKMLSVILMNNSLAQTRGPQSSPSYERFRNFFRCA